VTVASLFAVRPSILILDEPTTGLDWATARLLLDGLQELCEAGHTILLITHDMRLVAEYVQRVLLLHKGALLAQGTTREIFAQPDLLARVSVSPPPVTRLSHSLRAWGMGGDSLTVASFYREVVSLTSARSRAS
jgi:energy-coupling factor transport system ATP-binding protein